jgi:hypothetical protein
MSDEEAKIVKFPDQTPAEPPKKDEILWECKACKHVITESMEKDEANGSRVLPLNMGGMMVYVCPNCRTFQLPEEVFDKVMKKATSNIIS